MRGPGLLAGALLAPLALVLLAATAALGGVPSAGQGAPAGAQPEGVSRLASRDIPAGYLNLYEAAARRYDLDWAILAAIGKVECDHGRDPDPSCTHPGSVNGAGAGGPMQFLGSTWSRYAVDGNDDGTASRWDPADAIYAAASYLRSSGAPTNYPAAIFAYNHAGWYVAEVEAWAARYRSAAGGRVAPAASVEEEEPASGYGMQAGTQTPVRYIAGERAVLSPADGHLALIPVGVPPTVQAMLVAGNELQALPYGPEGHPDPRGAPAEDCSSTVNYVLYRAGLRPIAEIVRDNPLAQDYVDWGAPGPGRWVTIYATTTPTDHVFVVLAGLRLDTSHAGTDVGPNSGQDGPRWRVLDHIPTWAHWSVRHPPGL